MADVYALAAEWIRVLVPMDDMTDAEKIKSPVVIGGLALLIAPFIVGAIALAFYR